MTDIVERLRSGILSRVNDVAAEADDEIVRLRAEVAERDSILDDFEKELTVLRAERDEQRSLANGRMAALIAAEEERVAAEAERDRLRGWISEARKWCQDGLCSNAGAEYCLERIHEAANDILGTALGATPKAGEPT